jgi:hypothetical protein
VPYAESMASRTVVEALPAIKSVVQAVEAEGLTCAIEHGVTLRGLWAEVLRGTYHVKPAVTFPCLGWWGNGKRRNLGVEARVGLVSDWLHLSTPYFPHTRGPLTSTFLVQDFSFLWCGGPSCSP